MFEIDTLGFVYDTHLKIWKHKDQKHFTYNDGDSVETYILNSLQETKDVSVFSEELVSKIIDWPSLYHFSPQRSNLLRPFEKELTGKKVLEIGCGCGAITRYLGEVGADVLSVEGSLRRASIARERCRDMPNVNILCATTELLDGFSGFDIVLVIGVLEYSPMFLGGDGPSRLLSFCRNTVKENGSLLVAIENQLGLKYFAGTPEDHAGQAMYGINHSYKENQFRTWGKKELLELIHNSGFSTIEQYIPLPDYKLPVTIISPKGWTRYPLEIKNLATETVHKDNQRTPPEHFSLEIANELVWKNGLASDLANSFLLLCSNKQNHWEDASKILAYSYTTDRNSGLNKYTQYVEKNDQTIGILSQTLDAKNQLSSVTQNKFSVSKNLFFPTPTDEKKLPTGKSNSAMDHTVAKCCSRTRRKDTRKLQL